MYILFLGACYFSEVIPCTPDTMTGILYMPLGGDIWGVGGGELCQQLVRMKSQLTASAGAGKCFSSAHQRNNLATWPRPTPLFLFFPACGCDFCGDNHQNGNVMRNTCIDYSQLP
jgi:hypothetical protein